MSNSLSRRAFLKIASALAVSGAIAWVSDIPKVEADEAANWDVTDEQPLAPYVVERTPKQLEMKEEAPFIPYYLDGGRICKPIPIWKG